MQHKMIFTPRQELRPCKGKTLGFHVDED